MDEVAQNPQGTPSDPPPAYQPTASRPPSFRSSASEDVVQQARRARRQPRASPYRLPPVVEERLGPADQQYKTALDALWKRAEKYLNLNTWLGFARLLINVLAVPLTGLPSAGKPLDSWQKKVVIMLVLDAVLGCVSGLIFNFAGARNWIDKRRLLLNVIVHAGLAAGLMYVGAVGLGGQAIGHDNILIARIDIVLSVWNLIPALLFLWLCLRISYVERFVETNTHELQQTGIV